MAFDLADLRLVLALAAGLVYVLVGRAVGRRAVSDDATLAQRMFQFWWFGLAFLSLFTPGVVVLEATGLDTLPTMLVAIQVVLVLIVAALAGLVYYLLYLYTGKRVWIWPVALYHLALLALLEALLMWARPIGYGYPPAGSAAEAANSSKQILYEHSLAGSPWSLAVGLLLIVPPLLSAIAYFLLYFRLEDRTAKYRTATVSGALVFWFGSSTAATILGLSGNPAWMVASQVVSLAASLMVLAAYVPPKWVQRRLGVEPFVAHN